MKIHHKEGSTYTTGFGLTEAAFLKRARSRASGIRKRPAGLESSVGFSLIEILMVLVLLSIISGVASVIIFHGAASYAEMDTLRELSASGRLAVDRVSREMRSVRCTVSGNTCRHSASDITTWTGTDFAFVNEIGETRRVRLDAGSLKLTVGSNEVVLADSVSGLDLDYLAADGSAAATEATIWSVRATFTLSSGETSLNFRVRTHPRGLL